MKKYILIISITALLSGCASPVTPKTTLYNPKTKKTEVCGGGTTGYLVAGIVGYQIELSNNKKCVLDLQSKGYIIKSKE